MAQEFGTFEEALAMVAGEDYTLLAELRSSYVESVAQQLDLLGRVRCDANWDMVAERLRSMAAGFHDHKLIDLAAEALDSAPGEPAVVRKMRAHLADIGGQQAA